MIKPLQISATNETPKVDFNPNTGILLLRGTSISHQSDLFFQDVNDWILLYLKNPKPVSQFIIDLDFFNISSSKHLLDILYQLKSIQTNENMVTVEWHYNKKDDDMLELGQDYEMMVRLPFKYVGHELIKSSVC